MFIRNNKKRKCDEFTAINCTCNNFKCKELNLCNASDEYHNQCLCIDGVPLLCKMKTHMCICIIDKDICRIHSKFMHIKIEKMNNTVIRRNISMKSLSDALEELG